MIEITGQMGRSINLASVKTSQTQAKGTALKKNPAIGTPGTEKKRGSVPPPGPEREARLFKNINGVRTPGKDVAAAEQAYRESLEDSRPYSTNGTNVSAVTGRTSTTPVVESPGISGGDVLSTFKSALATYTPVLLIAAAVVLGVVIIKSAGSSGKGKGRR